MKDTEQIKIVTIRIRIGQYELEVKGPKKWAETQIEKFVCRRRKEADYE